jgi:cardiolipin synthase (CMP-forming)
VSTKPVMNLPNIITIGRILLVPLTIWAMLSQAYALAFGVFIAAGISDGVDGYLARRFSLHTELGSYLDPLADKALLVSIYVALGILLVIPLWLVITVVTRDFLIVSAVILSRLMEKPVAMKPLLISKINTVAQIGFAGTVLGMLALSVQQPWVIIGGTALVAALTFLSGAFYMRDWLRHMNGENPQRGDVST